MRNEWVMHIWGKKRDVLELTDIEKFHLYMLDKLKDQQKRLDKMIINIAMDDVDDNNLIDFLKTELSKVICCEYEIKVCKNVPNKSEYVTFRPYVFDRIGEDVNIFYSHFKGYASCLNLKRESYPKRVVYLNEMFWSYLMYMYSMNLDDVIDKIKDKCVYCWFYLKEEFEKLEDNNYYKNYQTRLCESNEKLCEYVDAKYGKHSPGSFCWYNMKELGKELSNKPDVINITDESLESLYTHFCELYLMRFLPDEKIYDVNVGDEGLKNCDRKMYTGLYVMKKVGREYIEDFEKYLIENNII